MKKIFGKVRFVLIILILFTTLNFTSCEFLTGVDDSGVIDNTDLDGDGIPDIQDSDMDGDDLSNIYEIEQGLDPRKADTDGDGWEDGVEIGKFDSAYPYSFNPLIADMPRLQVVFEDTPSVTLNYETSEGSTTSVTTEESTSFETSYSTSNSLSHSFASEYGWSVEVSVGAEVELGLDPGASLSFSATTGGHGSYTSEDSYTWEESQSISNQQAYTEAVSYEEDESVTTLGGKIEVPASIVNTGNIAFTIDTLSISAYMIDPGSDGTMGTLIGGLEGDTDTGITLNPGQSSGQINFVNDSLYVDDVLDIFAYSRGILCAISGYSIEMTTDEGTTDFTFAGTNVSAQTAKIIIDYGPTVLNASSEPRAAEQYNVATRTKYNPDFTSMDDMYLPVTMGDVLENIYLTYETGSYEGKTGLKSVRGVEIDIPNNKSWYVIHTYTRGTDSYLMVYSIGHESYDLEGIEIHTGDTVELIYTEDLDNDGLPSRIENILGTSDEDTDSDDDTISDYDETKGWTLDNGDVVNSNPVLADTDQDGLDDSEDDDPVTKRLSSDINLDHFEIGEIEYSELPSDISMSGDSVNIKVYLTDPVLSVKVNDEILSNEGGYYEIDYGILDIGVNNMELVITALDGVTTSESSFTLNSLLASVSDFSATSLGLDSLLLEWVPSTDTRVNKMMIIGREGEAVGDVPAGYYAEGYSAGGGEVLAVYDVGDFGTINLTLENLLTATDYYYKAINIYEDGIGGYDFAEASLASIATDTPDNMTMSFELYHIKYDINPGGEGNIELYYGFIGMTTYPLNLYFSEVRNDNHVVIESGEYYSFTAGSAVISAPVNPKVFTITDIEPVDGFQITLTAAIFDYDAE